MKLVSVPPRIERSPSWATSGRRLEGASPPMPPSRMARGAEVGKPAERVRRDKDRSRLERAFARDEFSKLLVGEELVQDGLDAE